MKYSGKKANNTYGKAVLIGLCVAVVSMILGAMLLSTFVISGSIGEEKIDIGVIALLIVSSVMGSVCVRVIKGEGSTIAVLILLGCVAALGLLSNVIFFGGSIHNLPWKMAVIATGGIVSVLRKKDKNKKYRSFKNMCVVQNDD